MNNIDDALDMVLSTPPARSLAEFPAVDPLPAQVVVVARALAVAREHGLPRLAFELAWVDAHEMQYGQTTLHANGLITMHLNANVEPAQLFETALHELQHVADYRDPATRGLPRLTLEKRAIAFVARVMGRQ